jgi:hypothetical protein
MMPDKYTTVNLIVPFTWEVDIHALTDEQLAEAKDRAKLFCYEVSTDDAFVEEQLFKDSR